MQTLNNKFNKAERSVYIWGTIIVLLSVIMGITLTNYWLFLTPLVTLGVFWAVIDWRSFYWFFLATIPFSIILDVPGGLSTTVPDEPIMWYYVGITILMLAYNKNAIPEWFLKHNITLILALQYIWLIIAVIFSEMLFPSIKYLLARTWFLNAFLIIPLFFFKEKKDFIRAFKVFFIPLFTVFLFVFVRHGFMNFGFKESNIATFPFFYNHVDHSTIISMAFPMFLIAYQLVKGNKKLRIILLLCTLFLIPAVFVAQARAAILAVIFALCIWFAYSRNIGKWIMPMFYAFVITIVTLVISNENYVGLRPDFKHTYTQTSFSNLLKATVSGKDMSSMERLYRWVASARMSQERPLLGVGPNNWNEFYKEHAITEFKTYVSRNPERSTTHNYFIFMLVEQGWPALILYGIFVWMTINYGQKLYKNIQDPFYKKAVLGLSMMFGAGFVNNFFSELLETHKIGALFFMSVSLMMIIEHICKKNGSYDAKK